MTISQDLGHGPHDRMLKFMLAARRKRTDTQERYFYEWGNIHVSLMLTTPVVMQVFKRYVQHYCVSSVADTDLILNRSPMQWDNMADHWLASYEDLLLALKGEGYVARMQPHKFGDDAFDVALMGGRILHHEPGFLTGQGGVKLVLWLRAPEGQDRTAFAGAWRERFAAALLASPAGARVRRYVHNTPLPVDAAMFQGTLFAMGGVNEFAAVDELWFDSLDDMASLRRDPDTYGLLRRAIDALAPDPRSYAMVTTERVVFDFVTPAERSPPPAVLNPDSLEARVVAQGFSGWNVPRPPAPR